MLPKWIIQREQAMPWPQPSQWPATGEVFEGDQEALQVRLVQLQIDEGHSYAATEQSPPPVPHEGDGA